MSFVEPAYMGMARGEKPVFVRKARMVLNLFAIAASN
jgi:hypothetical protein